MKKNVLKILLAFVMMALVFALVACNGGGDDTKKKTDKNKDKEPANVEEEVDAVEQLKTSIGSVVDGVNPYFEAIKGIKADSTVGINVAVGGYYDNTGSEPSAGNFKLGVAGNARGTNPELKVAFSMDESKNGAGTDYVAIGYKGGSLYIAEPLSLINKGKNAEPNQIAMDASLLSDGVDNVATFGMEKLAGVVGGINIDLKGTVDGLLKGQMVDMVAGFIESDIKSNPNEIALVISSSNAGKLVKSLGMFIDSWDSIAGDGGTIDSLLETAYDKLGLYVSGNTVGIDKEKAQEAGAQKLTFAKVTTDFMPSLKIIGAFDKANTADDKQLNAVKVEINFEKLNLAVGLSIDLNMLAIGSTTTVSFKNYEAQNLTSSINVGLGTRDRYAKLTATANTASAFASMDTNVATASLTLGNGTNKAVGTANATYDGQSIYLDFSEYAANIATAAGYQGYDASGASKFVHTFTFGDNAADFGKEVGDAFNIKYAVKYMLENVGKSTDSDEEEEEEEVVVKGAVAEGAKIEAKGIWTTVYNMILAIKEGYFGQYDYIGSDAKNKKYPLYVWDQAQEKYVVLTDEEGTKVYLDFKTEATQEDVTYLLSTVSWIDKYVNVQLANGNKGLSFEQIINNLKEKFEDVEEIFTGENAAAQASDNKASVALFGNDGKNLIAVVTMFVRIPTVDDNHRFVKDNDGKFVVDVVEIKTAADARAYLDAIFALDDEDAATSYADWDAEVKEVFGITAEYGFQVSIISTVLGISVESFCANGVVLYAQFDEDEGLSGAIGIENEEGANYIEIGGSIGFVEAEEDLASVADTSADVEAPIAEKEITEGEEEWHMNQQIWKTIVASLKFAFPAAV